MRLEAGFPDLHCRKFNGDLYGRHHTGNHGDLSGSHHGQCPEDTGGFGLRLRRHRGCQGMLVEQRRYSLQAPPGRGEGCRLPYNLDNTR